MHVLGADLDNKLDVGVGVGAGTAHPAVGEGCGRDHTRLSGSEGSISRDQQKKERNRRPSYNARRTDDSEQEREHGVLESRLVRR